MTDASIYADQADFLETGITRLTPGLLHMDVHVPDMHCAGCISKIEKSLNKHPAIAHARVSLSTKRVAIDWHEAKAQSQDLINHIKALGFEVHPIDADAIAQTASDKQKNELLRALAVAGFAASNIMLLSVAVWSGAEAATRDMFHWISALIALPAVVYAGRPFFKSAWAVLRAGHVNMDVPISLGVLLATAMSFYQTMTHTDQAYFDAAVMLLFFLLVGRTLDHLMRAKAHSAIAHLVSLAGKTASRIMPDGKTQIIAASKLAVGDEILVAAGESLAADGTIALGKSDVDQSLVTGEAMPRTVQPGDKLFAGMINLTGPLQMTVTAIGKSTFLGEIIRLMEAAEQGKARYVRLADKAAQFYAPMVHSLAGLTFAGWLLAGADWQTSLFTAIAVLIITCPCALGLAVPVVQIIASGRLFNSGILMKDGAGLEKLSTIDTIVFDKTGTLTLGTPKLIGANGIKPDLLAIAAGLASQSKHPLSRALSEQADNLGIKPAKLTDIKELAGSGLEGKLGTRHVKLGSAKWCGVKESSKTGLLEVCLRIGDEKPIAFKFADELRFDARDVIERLQKDGLGIHILSGDREANVSHIAGQLGVEHFKANCTPQNKVAFINKLAEQDHRVLMVGDGLNDAPALAAGYTSMAPASATDIGRVAADFVFMGDRLEPVVTAISIARRSDKLVKQNFCLAILYNVIAVPIAVLGFASPLIAAIAMSSSSLIVVGNAMRLKLAPLNRIMARGKMP